VQAKGNSTQLNLKRCQNFAEHVVFSGIPILNVVWVSMMKANLNRVIGLKQTEKLGMRELSVEIVEELEREEAEGSLMMVVGVRIWGMAVATL
jgi:hypothetical protein